MSFLSVDTCSTSISTISNRPPARESHSQRLDSVLTVGSSGSTRFTARTPAPVPLIAKPILDHFSRPQPNKHLYSDIRKACKEHDEHTSKLIDKSGVAQNAIERQAKQILRGDVAGPLNTDALATMLLNKVRSSKSTLSVAPTAEPLDRSISQAASLLSLHASNRSLNKSMAMLTPNTPRERFRNAVKAVIRAFKFMVKQAPPPPPTYTLSPTEMLFQFMQTTSSMTAEAMEIWARPAENRPEADVETLAKMLSFIKPFQKIPKSVRHEFCRFAVLETFEKDRYLVKQGQKPFILYFILTGTIDCVRQETIAKNKVLTHVTKQLSSGDFIGDLDHEAVLTTRTFSGITAGPVKVLRIDIDDWRRVHAIAAEKDIVGKMKFLRSLKIFSELNDEHLIRRIAEHAILKDYVANACIIREGEKSDDVYFVRKGGVRIMKTVEFIRRRLFGNRFIMLPFTGRELTQDETRVSKLLVLEHLGPGRYFGEGPALFEGIKGDPVAADQARKYKRPASIVTDSASELLMMSKLDFQRFANNRVMELLKEDREKKMMPLSDICENYLLNRQWKHYKKRLVGEITAQLEYDKAISRRILLESLYRKNEYC